MIFWVQDFTQTYNQMLKNISAFNETLTNISPGVCSVYTMTVCGLLNTHPLSLSAEWMRRIVKSTETLEAHDFTCTVNSKQFLNCVSINSGSVSVKLFNNGKTQLTGAKGLIHYLEIMDRVCRCLSDIHGTHHALEKSSIAIMNIKFSTNCRIPLQKFRDAMSGAHPDLVSSYDPDTRYPGVTCKHMEKKATLMVFKTGYIIICAKKPEDIELMYTRACSLLQAMGVTSDTKHINTTSKTGTDMFMIQQGYSSSILHLAHLGA